MVVYAYYADKSVNVTLMTDIDGTAHFSFDTLDWSENPVQLQVSGVFVFSNMFMYIIQVFYIIFIFLYIRSIIRENKLISRIMHLTHQAIFM